MAGGSLINGKKRVAAVRPDQCNTKNLLAPVNGGLGDHGRGARDGPEEEGGARDEWEEVADKYNQLEEKVREYLGESVTEALTRAKVQKKKESSLKCFASACWRCRRFKHVRASAC